MSDKTIIFFYYDGFVEFEIALALFYLGKPTIRTVALEQRVYISMEGQRFLPDAKLSEINPVDVSLLVIPGGNPNLLIKEDFIAGFIGSAVSNGAKIAGICGGADLLVALGFLEGRKCTGNAFDPNNSEIIREQFKKTRFTNEPVVIDGNFITAKGDAFAEFAYVLASIFKTNKKEILVLEQDFLSPVEGQIDVSDSVIVFTSKFEQCNLTLIVSENEALLVDTGYRLSEAMRALKYLNENKLKLKGIVITHLHEDHLANLELFASGDVPQYNPKNIDEDLKLQIGLKPIKLFSTPGHHLEGDISVLIEDEEILIAGDILYSCLPPQLSYGAKPDILTKTIKKIASKHFRWIVPGHGRVMTGDSLTTMSLSYINTLYDRIRLIILHQGTVDDLTSIKLSECITHPEWMEEEPSIDLHRQNKEELFVNLSKQDDTK